MVHRMDTGNVSPESKNPPRKSVKMEIDDFFQEHHSLCKRTKLDLSHQHCWSLTTSAFPDLSSLHNPLEEPSPLGLKLKKSPSFLDLIQMTLTQERSTSLAKTLPKKEKDHKSATTVDKLKASNFPAMLLRIGTWEYISRYEGDLVAKCYFAKHKLVWEVLDGGLKNKIEIQWSDIMAIKANYPDDAPGTLNVVLARQPLFFREINPQPRKHTLWQATSDFTGGQATIYRQHFLQSSQGLLGKHFEKLIQCDPRLNYLSKQPEIVLDSPYFEAGSAVLVDPNDSKGSFGLKTEDASTSFGLTDEDSTFGGCLSSSEIEMEGHQGVPANHISQGNPSCSSVIEGDADSGIKETDGQRLLNQIGLPGLQKSMSVSDLVSHIGQRISEQSGDDVQKNSILEEIAQYLLNDSQLMPVSDEKSVMSRVNSLCCLLQRDPSIQNLQVLFSENASESTRGDETTIGHKAVEEVAIPEGETAVGNGCKHPPAMSRKDSIGDLLLNLPRIASLPQFLFNVSEDAGNQAR
ncbi:hypothetical protein Ancab_029878 [Ancistrocladus abbreviatus]